MYIFGLLSEHKVRYLLTAFGIALCSLLMFFLVSIYEGISYGSVQYIRLSSANLWILQEHTTNILRSTSLLPLSSQEEIGKISGIKSISPVFFIIASAKIKSHNATLYLTGFDPGKSNGGPPLILKGRNIQSDNEIVLDRAFASKYGLKIGDKITIRKDSMTISGICTGTNMFVIQYAFISLVKAQEIIGFKYAVSAFQLVTEPGISADSVKTKIYSSFKNVVVFDKATFLRNNLEEMQNGIIPVLFIVTLIAAIVLTSILSLMLSVTILEKRLDFAIMKALGSKPAFIPGQIVRLSLVLSVAGLVLALIFYFPMEILIQQISPEVEARTSFFQIVVISSGVIAISIISSFLPNLNISKIYPIDIFR